MRPSQAGPPSRFGAVAGTPSRPGAVATATGKEADIVPQSLIREVQVRLAADRRVRRALPGRGRLHIDRALPFLCVYRRRAERSDEGTERLVLGEASYLLASGEEPLQESLNALVDAIVTTSAERFGAFLIVELWSADEDGPVAQAGVDLERRHVRILTPHAESLPTTVQTLADALQSMELPGPPITVEVIDGGRAAPPGLPPFLTTTAAAKLGCLMIGLELTPFYREPVSGQSFPLLLRRLHREISRALQKTFFDFVTVQTAHRPDSYQMLGRRTVVRAVWDADRELAEISQSFDLLLSVTPVNSDAAYTEFVAAKCERAPVFHYRMLPVDPEALKRALYLLPLDRVEDPALALLLREKRGELDRQLNLLEDRDTPRFLYGSLQLYGGPDEALKQHAECLLSALPTRDGGEDAEGGVRTRTPGSAASPLPTADEPLDAAALADRVRAEIEAYRQLYPVAADLAPMSAGVEIRDDVPGLMVSHGKLLIGQRTRVARSRLEAVVQHEVGTHIVTYVNGCAQPLRQLSAGLPGYAELQEGLAVLAEYLVGGLHPSRLRILAGRVIAVDCLVRGGSFVDIFRELHHTHGFGRRTAFTMTMRVCRGGGFTKDVVYLRGLRNLMEYLAQGGELEPLFVGKIHLTHVPLIQELQWRETLRPTLLLPLYLGSACAREKLEQVRAGRSVLDLIERV